MTAQCPCLLGTINVSVWSLLSLGCLCYTGKSTSLWDSQGSPSYTFSWCVVFFCGCTPYQTVGLSCPNRKLPALLEQEMGQEPAPSPSWGSGVGGNSPGWRKKVSDSICGGGRKHGSLFWRLIVSLSQKQSRSVRAQVPLTEKQWWREHCP